MKKNILVLGATGMLGIAMMKVLSKDDSFDLTGTVRSLSSFVTLPKYLHKYLREGINIENFDSVIKVFDSVMPDIVINCIGIIKQLPESYDPLVVIPINSILPHRLARLCTSRNIRLIHMSTDCIFSGNKGGYHEDDFPDANDLYGRSKFLGEVDYVGCVTLRTSIIGHELTTANSLISWFLSQQGSVKGYTNTIFSGLPTNEMAIVIRDYVIPNSNLKGLYQVSADPISKFDLLQLVSQIYGKKIEIIPDNHVKIDRSLNSEKFSKATGYRPKPWSQLIKEMYEFNLLN